MKKRISAKLAGNILLFFFALLAVFHVLVLLEIAPYEIIWGGQIKDTSSLVVFEGIALILLLLFAVIVAIRIDYIKAKRLKKLANIGVWVIFVYFLLNTIANLSSGVTLEKLIFTPITIILTVFAFRLAIEKDRI